MILIVVINVLKVICESGLLIKVFEVILNFKKMMLFILIDESVDVDVLRLMWFKNWNDV